jgi:predicted nucleotidyltransferase
LDGPVLEVLAGTTRALTGRAVHRLAAAGSHRGIQLVLHRLEEQGLVLAEPHGNAVLYVANRQHLAWPALESLVRLRLALRSRLVEELEGWPLAPLHVSMFGSAARGDGNSSSDIDLLIVRPPGLEPDAERWNEQIDRLREVVRAWTGNRCQILDIGRDRLDEHVAARDPIVSAWLADGVHLLGTPLVDLLVAVPTEGRSR